MQSFTQAKGLCIAIKCSVIITAASFFLNNVIVHAKRNISFISLLIELIIKNVFPNFLQRRKNRNHVLVIFVEINIAQTMYFVLEEMLLAS